ncbi:MAG: type II toxin-antitoxin system RelE/ParE family toxin [Nitrosospira sp.]|nr:type II toxin-antitoxin system RelE/ParE family toxin [Nitrosospira sp.]
MTLWVLKKERKGGNKSWQSDKGVLRSRPQYDLQAIRAEQLSVYPQLGVPLDEFAPRDVRRVIVGDYELRYELTPVTLIYILRVWHAREDR